MPNQHAWLQEVRTFAQKHLSGLSRRCGTSYFDHCAEVAHTLREITDDTDLIAAALCHDIPVCEHGETLLESSPLSLDQRSIVQKMYALRRLHIDEDTKDLNLMIKNFTQDGRIVLLRLAHRLNDVRHIDRFTPELAERIAQETLYMYTSIAWKLGLYNWRRELEDRSFAVLHPAESEKITTLFTEQADIDRECINLTTKFLQEQLQAQGIDCTIETRIKGVYSTYRKMVLKERRFDELTDRLALRIIVDDAATCYRVLGIIHQIMSPIPGKLKDYIGAPKPNGYQSIHTVVYPLKGVTQQPIEIQIRTHTMHRECMHGVACHSNYKLWSYQLSRPSARMNLFRNFQHLRSTARSPQQFASALKRHFHSKSLVVFDEKNALYHLQHPATAMDFACLTYGQKCRRIKGAKINGQDAALDSPLHNGDVVEIIFGRTANFQPSWLDACEHEQNRAMVREWVQE